MFSVGLGFGTLNPWIESQVNEHTKPPQWNLRGGVTTCTLKMKCQWNGLGLFFFM